MNARSLSGINDVTSNGDVALTMNARSMSGINDTFGGGGDVFQAGNPNTFTGTNTFNTNRPTSTLATTPGTNDFITKSDGQSLFTNNTGDALLNGANTFTGLNTFNTNRPTSNLATAPGTNDFITKSDGETLFGGGGDALLDGGTEASPQTFTEFNQFDNTTIFNRIDIEPTTGGTGLTSILKMTAADNNLIEQEQTAVNSYQGNEIYQHGGTVNRIFQKATGTYLNRILQEGGDSLIETEGTLDAANIIVNSTAVASSPFGGGNINIEQATATVNGRLYIGTPPTNLPLFGNLTNPALGYFSFVRGGIYVDGEEGIRIPRRGLYDRTGLREWRIDHYSGGGSSQSGVNCLTFNFSATSDTSLLGNFLTKARLQSNGRLELDANLLQNQNFSDARLKTNNKYLENATESLLKLSVQTYDKAKVNNFNLNEPTGETVRETGLIAQEVYYNAPEFRDLVSAGREYNDEFDLSGNQSGDGKPEGTEIIPDEMDLSGVAIGEDPDYEGAGWSKTERASIEYQGFIAYLIKSNQELHERISILEAKINNM